MSSQSISILGRQPALGLAELESLFGSGLVQVIGDSAALLDIEPADVPFARLGGSVKIAKLLHVFETTSWNVIEKYLGGAIPELLGQVPEGKFNLGLSVYNFPIPVKKLFSTGLSLKKTIKATGRSVRLVPNKEPALNSAQVLYNKLTGPLGCELIFVRDGNQVYMGQTTNEQDIDAYAARDQARPRRDARIGMLPPKLAQIIINLASPGKEKAIIDPFCGTGVVLQEALLMGLDAFGGDNNADMVSSTTENIQWLIDKWRLSGVKYNVNLQDATDDNWDIKAPIACETYLGRSFSSEPDAETLQKVMQDVAMIHKKFLRSVASKTKPGYRMCIAVPAWYVSDEVYHLKTLDSLEELGYTRISFVRAGDEDLIYHREGQIVGRELVTLIRK